MKTVPYSSTQLLAGPFDWCHFLRPRRPETIKESEWHVAVNKSRSWVTCACGNQCATIPRSGSGMPMDHELLRLGGQFAYATGTKDRTRMRKILIAIEKRSGQILRQIKKTGSFRCAQWR